MNLRKDHYHTDLGLGLPVIELIALSRAASPCHTPVTVLALFAPMWHLLYCGLMAKPTTVAVCALSNQGVGEVPPIHFYLL